MSLKTRLQKEYIFAGFSLEEHLLVKSNPNLSLYSCDFHPKSKLEVAMACL